MLFVFKSNLFFFSVLSCSCISYDSLMFRDWMKSVFLKVKGFLFLIKKKSFWFFFFFSFTGVRTLNMRSNEIHKFKVYNTVLFSIGILLYSRSHLFGITFYTRCLAIPHFLFPQSLATIILLSASRIFYYFTYLI